MPVILEDVGHRFGEGEWLFRHLELSLEPGRVYSLTGPSGAGKSTLLDLIAGWSRPVEGSVSREAVDAVGWVFQSPHGPPRRTALDIVSFPLIARGLEQADAARRAIRLLCRFGLGDRARRQFRTLSGGERQRLMLARAFAAEPGVLLFDEPTAQLDRSTASSVNAAIGRLAQGGTVVVVATHDAETRDACTDHIELGAWVPKAERSASVRGLW